MPDHLVTSHQGTICRGFTFYVPLLHVAAGSLSADAARAWSSHPLAGDRWVALVMALRHAAPADPRVCARPVSAVADLEAHEARRPTVPAEHELVNALAAHPSTALTLPAAVALSTDREGYITAAAQSALLEAFAPWPWPWTRQCSSCCRSCK